MKVDMPNNHTYGQLTTIHICIQPHVHAPTCTSSYVYTYAHIATTPATVVL